MRDRPRPARADYEARGGRREAGRVSRVILARKRLGSLLVNRAAPAARPSAICRYAGIGYPAQVRARYDLVGVDPGGGAQRAGRVPDGPADDAFTQVDQTPDDAAETSALAAVFKEFAAAREASAGCSRMSTVAAARDMDVVRGGALGDRKLNYVGASYGTFLGATYAEPRPGQGGR